jgi:hypothetical protein
MIPVRDFSAVRLGWLAFALVLNGLKERNILSYNSWLLSTCEEEGIFLM